MNLQFLRQSSINTYHDCEFKYFMECILEIPSLAGKKALMGTLVHHVLELLARCKKNNHLTGKYVDYKYLLDICWDRYKREESHRFNFMPADKVFCLKSIEKVLDGNFNPLKLNILDTERSFVQPLKKDGFSYEYHDIIKKETKKGWYEIRGTIDLVTKVDEDTIEIIDWKTGKRTDWVTGKLKDYDYLSKDDIQLRLYDLATYLLYPNYKHRLLTIHFINDGGPFTVAFDDKDREETYERLKKEFLHIKNNPLPSRLKERKPQDAKWKCSKVCHFGKTMAPNGACWCDNIHTYMINHSVDETILKIKEIKDNQSKASIKEGKTSDRRNKHKEETEK